MGDIQDLIHRIKRRVFGPEFAQSESSDEATAKDTTLDREGPPLTKALTLDLSNDAYLRKVAEADLSPEEVPVITGLTPEEYIEYVVSAAEGRLTQRALVNHTGWSPSVVSRLLSKMEEQGRLVLVSRGRMTLICLPDATVSQPSHG